MSNEDNVLNDGFAVVLEQMERDCFEEWCKENSVAPARIKGADQYIVPAVQDQWVAWKARAAHSKPCRGVAHHGCNYLAGCGSICNKCGQAV